jgi:3-phosphoshikimate 1-carboxyvinyltransferase
VAHDLILTPHDRPLTGSVPVPADERVAPLRILCAALATGTSELLGNVWGERTGAMVGALRCFGVAVDVLADRIRVEGVGLAGFSAARGAVDCGDAAATMELLAGALVAQPFASVLVHGAGAEGADLQRLAKPLRWRGGVIEGVFTTAAPGTITAPLTVGPLPDGVHLCELEYDLGVSSGEVKSAVLLSGLYADGSTYLREPFVSCDHAERLLQALDVPVSTAGSIVELDAAGFSGRLPGANGSAVGDAGAAAMLLAAAALVPGSRVSARNVGLNPTRTGAMYLLRQMGGDVASEVHAHVLGEPAGVATAAHARLRAVAVDGEAAFRAAGEIGVLAALAARADGVSVFEPALFSPDKGARLVGVLRAFGVGAEFGPAGLAVEGRPEGRLAAAEVDARHDFDLGAASLLLGLVADGPARVRRVDGLVRRFPRAVATLRALGVDLRVEESAVSG